MCIRDSLVTGHTGFQGGWLSLWLKKLGANVIGYSLEPPTEPSFFESVKLNEELEHIIGDIRDESRINEIITEFKPEIIFHLAEQSLVRESYNNPIETFETNILGTANILEAAADSTVSNPTPSKTSLFSMRFRICTSPAADATTPKKLLTPSSPTPFA